MKKFAIALFTLVLVGAGCSSGPQVFEGELYENTEFGFSYNYPEYMDVNVRTSDVRQYNYLGIDLDFFVSVRDIVISDKPHNIAYFYAAKGLTVEQFVDKLKSSSTVIEFKSADQMEVNDLKLTRVLNTTQYGTDKVHYLFNRGSQTIIVSVFIEQEETFDEMILPSLQGIQKI